MKKYFLVLVLAGLIVSGCGKKSESQQAMVNTDSLTVSQADSLMAQPADEAKKDVAESVPGVVVDPAAAPLVEETVPAVSSSAVSDTPDDRSIQQALKNFGLYNGAIDGKIGNKTKEAIREFQRENQLGVDGKVGPKTWALLRKGLEISGSTTASTQN